MMTLKVPLAPSHVDALNSIHVEFYDDEKVLAAWRLYASHLNQHHTTTEEINRWGEKKFDLLVELVYLIAQSLGYTGIDRASIRDNTYVPKGYANVEAQWEQIRQGWLDWLNGQRPVAMTMVGPVQVQEPFKPVQEITVPQQRPQALPSKSAAPSNGE